MQIDFSSFFPFRKEQRELFLVDRTPKVKIIVKESMHYLNKST